MTTLCNRVQVSTGGTAYLLLNYKNEGPDGFLLSLFDGNNVWKGKFDEDDIENIKKTKDALSCEYSSDLSYELYKLNSQRTEFQWHYASDEDISYMVGSCALKPASDPFKSICEILDHCIDRNKEMKERLSAIQTDYDRISQERANALKRLEKCAVAKEELEKELCTKCIDVLNSNKEKNGQINNANGDLLAGPSHAEEEPIKTGVKRAKKRSAPSDDEESGQEKSDADATHKKKRPRKSKKAMTKSPQKDDSVVLDPSDCSLGTSLVSRPRRNAEANKQKIPSKPVFPKVTSSEQKQRNAYDSNFKLEVVSFAEKHTNAETMRYFGINEKLVRDWKKAKTKLEALEKPVKKIRFNSSPIEDIEKELIAWVTNSIDQGYIVNRGAIRLKALEYATKDNTLASQDFKASAGWCTRFMKRHGLCFHTTKRESEQSISSKKGRTASSSSTASNQSPDNIDLEDFIDNL